MARIRSLKPEFWADEDLGELSRDARLLYMGLWNLSDEHGRLRGDARYIKGQLFPYDDDLDAKAIDGLIAALAGAGKVRRYSSANRSYLWLPNLAKHQRLEPDKVPSRLPDPSDSSQPDVRADESAPDPDESAPDAEDHALLYVAGSMDQVAGSREHGGAALTRSRGDRTREDAEFDRFWSVYPRREAKIAARKAWDKAILRVDSERILAGAERYRDLAGREPQFTAHAASWLNGSRWDDEPVVRGSPGLREHNGFMVNDRTMADLERHDRLAAFEAAQQQQPQQLAIEG
jgi:hypothetical protein